MTKAHLASCPSCARHVRVDEPACPFCGSALDAAFHATAAPRRVSARLSRAAIYALGTSSLTLAACGMAMPAYGAPPVDLDGGSPSTDSGIHDGGAASDSGRTDVLDAAPDGETPEDSGAADDAIGPPEEAGREGGREGGAGPVYGAPPQPDF